LLESGGGVVPEARFPATWSGQTAVISAAGAIDLTNAEPLRDALLSAFNAGATAVVVDLTAATFLDSAGIAALVHASRRARRDGADLRVAAGSAVLRILELVGLDQLVPVYLSVEAALASLAV
jgi:anti-sigma B factor antagonist